MKPIAVYSGQRTIGSWGWRHALTWRQLSALWELQIEEYELNSLSTPPAEACAYSLAITPGDSLDLTALERCIAAAPVIVFVNRVALHFDGSLRVEKKADEGLPGPYRHVLQIQAESRLTAGLPRRVVTFGPLRGITAIPVGPDMEMLVWLDGLPIVGYQHPHLFIGADPWQLGSPSVPLIYPILRAWLSAVVRHEPRIAAPLAAIRLDDLPTTAEELLHRLPTPALDRRRASTLRRLREFSMRSGIRLNLMYSSHYYSHDGTPKSIGDVMPLSIREIRSGVEQEAFEVGAHGMIHLRHGHKTALLDADPREFLDLDETLTHNHLTTCTEEIRRLFGAAPTSFVAPAWGYRPTVTKRLSGQRFRVVIDSSQHVEDGSSNVFSKPGEEYPAFNCTETFRQGESMLSFASVAFWKCYALGGIPVHYMQHTDTNWHLLRALLSSRAQQAALQPRALGAALNRYLQDARYPRSGRACAAAWLLLVVPWREPTSISYVWQLLSASSLYTMVKSIRAAGYTSMSMSQLATSALRPSAQQ